MAKYSIVADYDDRLYCLVVRDDGSSFGQMVYGEQSTTIDGVEEVINAALSRNGRKKREPEVVDAILTRAELQVRKINAITRQ